MRHLIAVVCALTFLVAGCANEEPQCPEPDQGEEYVACECGDGTEGVLECEEGTADCICDDESDDEDDDNDEDDDDGGNGDDDQED